MNRKPVRVATVIALAGSLALASCSRIQPPDVTLTGVDFNGISADGIEFTLMADVTNANDFDASLGRLEYSVRIDGTEIAQGERTKDVEIRAGATEALGIPFTLTWDGVKKGMKEFLDGEEHEWKLKGSATVLKGALSRTFRFEEVGHFRGPSEKDVELGT